MWQTIGELLPSAVGPIPIIAIVLMLGTQRARSNGMAFASGWIVGLTTVAVLIVLLASDADQVHPLARPRRQGARQRHRRAGRMTRAVIVGE